MIIMSQDRSKIFYFGIGCAVRINKDCDAIIALAPGDLQYTLLGEYNSPDNMRKIIEDIMQSTMSYSFFYMPKEG